MKRYRLEFECQNPFNGQWDKAARETDESGLPGLEQQMKNQRTMDDPGVRNSRMLVQEVSEWSEMPEGRCE